MRNLDHQQIVSILSISWAQWGYKIFILSSDWLRVITLPWYWPNIGSRSVDIRYSRRCYPGIMERGVSRWRRRHTEMNTDLMSHICPQFLSHRACSVHGIQKQQDSIAASPSQILINDANNSLPIFHAHKIRQISSQMIPRSQYKHEVSRIRRIKCHAIFMH